MTKRQKRGWHGLLVVLSMILLLTACTSKAQKAVEKVELGQKYLTEQNYTEAVASFTEAIGLDPENIPAYMGRAEVNELTTANETAWADVSEAENGAVTAEALTAAAPTAEEIGAVSLSKLYVYYGSHENRSREGEGVWLVLNPGKKDLTA